MLNGREITVYCVVGTFSILFTSIILLCAEVDWAVNDASTRVITVAANINRDPFILTILAADGIHIALRGQFQCMKAALKNGILTPVSIGLWEEDGLYMICSNHVENEDVFAVVGSSCLWEIFEPIEMITLVSKQKREVNEFNFTKSSLFNYMLY